MHRRAMALELLQAVPHLDCGYGHARSHHAVNALPCSSACDICAVVCLHRKALRLDNASKLLSAMAMRLDTKAPPRPAHVMRRSRSACLRHRSGAKGRCREDKAAMETLERLSKTEKNAKSGIRSGTEKLSV